MRRFAHALSLLLQIACSETANKASTPDDDLDDDGVPATEDCDDEDASREPGAREVCGDGLVNDCEGTVSAAYADCADRIYVSEAHARMTGEDEYDSAGCAVDAAGDVDGDGFSDIIVGAYNQIPEDGSAGGAAYLVSGTVEGEFSLAGASAKMVGESWPDSAGMSVAGAGDVDGDGYADLLVGAPWNSPDVSYGGATYVVLGPAAGTIPLATAHAKISGDIANSYVGWAVSGVGDADGDGLSDILIGTPHVSVAGVEHGGAAYLVSGSVSGASSVSETIATLAGDEAERYAGLAVSDAGDSDGDGLSDYIVGAAESSYCCESPGTVYLVRAPVSGVMGLDDADATFASEGSADKAGASVAGAGDVNGDGLADQIVGARMNDDGGEDAGAAYVLEGPSSGSDDLSAAAAKLLGQRSEDHAGVAVDGAGDVDGDGRSDLLIGADGETSMSLGAGAAYVVLGAPVGTVELAHAEAKIVGESWGSAFGGAVAGGQDTNGDGFSDLIIGDYRESLYDPEYSEFRTGAVHLVRGGGY